MKNILVTGVSGFVGSNIIRLLKKDNTYNVIALSMSAIPGTKTIIHKNYTFTKNDFIKENVNNIDILIHAGAFTPKKASDSNDVIQSSSNITNTQHLLLNLPSIPSKVLFLSTLDVYDSNEHIISEGTPTNPATLYGWSKLYCEKLVAQWGAQNGVSTNVLRLGHIYGAGEEAYQKIIPVTIKKCLSNESPVIFTDGSEKRAFLHIEDCAQAIVNAVSLEGDNLINIVSEESLTVLDVVKTIRDAVNPGLEIEIKQEMPSGRSMQFDATKMFQLLHHPKMSFKQGIADEIEKIKP